MTRQTPAVGVEFENHKKKIHQFCERPTHTGGVLLVTGTRGVGKTRLVDEALNERNTEYGCGRIERLRLPRGLMRFIIKVDVDPNFPHPKAEAGSGADTQPDENTLAFILIRNIVFALTSTIDSRFSLRKHGKTLYARLGFLNYWFAPNGLLPGVFKGWCVLMLLGMLMSLTCLLHHGLILKWLPVFILQLLKIDAVAIPLGSAFACSAIIMVLAWLSLRWLDLRALAHISEDLYDLVHAQEKNKNHTHEREDKSEISSKLPWFLLLAVLVWAFYNPQSLTSLSKSTPQEANAAAENIPLSPQTTKENKPLIGSQALVLAAGMLVTFLVTRTRKSTKLDSANFGTKNPVWMITLLRRYLFLCHRCGLEPVLVMDELDKLEEIEYWFKHHKHPSENTETQAGLSKLGMFLMAIARLKSSLGAEFLWILISGSKLYAYLQEDRHDCKNSALGLLATVIQQDIVVGPTAYNTAKTRYPGLDDKKSKELWLRSRGNFATMIRMNEAGEELISSSREEKLADAVIAVWSSEQQKRLLGFSNTLGIEEKLKSEWVQIWIHAGMLEVANRFVKQSILHSYFVNALAQAMLGKYDNQGNMSEEITALFSGTPDLLSLLGEKLFYAYLNDQGLIEKLVTTADASPIRFNAGFYE